MFDNDLQSIQKCVYLFLKGGEIMNKTELDRMEWYIEQMLRYKKSAQELSCELTEAKRQIALLELQSLKGKEGEES